VQWLEEGQHIVYTRSGASGTPTEVWLHQVGQDESADRQLYEEVRSCTAALPRPLLVQHGKRVGLSHTLVLYLSRNGEPFDARGRLQCKMQVAEGCTTVGVQQA
jgi:hypothetical protein